MIGDILRALKRPGLLARIAARADPLAMLLLDDSAGASLVIDRTGQIVCANAAMANLLGAMLGSTAPSLRGLPVASVFHPSDRDAALAEIAALWRGRRFQRRSFATVLAAGTAAQEARVSVLSLIEADAGPCGALLRFVDVGPQRQLEAQLAQSQKLQATGQLAGGIAHDFNNLLTAILGAADEIVARERSHQPQSGTIEDALQIRASAERGAALVRQLLAFGRKQALQPRRLAVNDVIEDVSGLLRRLLGSKVRLVVDLERPGRQVRADPTQLDQVIINLAVNGRNAMPDGGLLTLRSGHSTLFRPFVHGAETIPPGRYVMIEVQDTGCGIPADIIPRIFDPFFTTRREAGGSGLGLSTVHGIIRQSDGFLTVDSTPGVGTSMRVYLPRWDGADAVTIPARPTPALPVAPAAQDQSGPARRGTVLLVDDDEPVRLLAQRALTRGGWNVISADSGESALELLSERHAGAPPLQALISDMVMPGLDGAALAERVRKQFAGDDLPVILVSGYAQATVPGASGSAEPACGRFDFLPKPYSLADLVRALEAATLGLK